MRLKMVPWLCSCFRTILCFPCHCFLTIFLLMSSWKHDFLYSCFLTCSVLYPNIILDEERMAKSLQDSTTTEILHFPFVVVLGLSSINMAFLSVVRNYRSLKDFLFFSGWEMLHSSWPKGKSLHNSLLNWECQIFKSTQKQNIVSLGKYLFGLKKISFSIQ